MCHLEDMNCQEEDEKEYQEMKEEKEDMAYFHGEPYDDPNPNQDRSEELRAALVNSLTNLKSQWEKCDSQDASAQYYEVGTINGLRIAIDIVHSLTLSNSSRIIP